MSPGHSDYGQRGDTTALVPGSLVVYRHFQLDLEAGCLLPMNYRPPKSGRYHPPAYTNTRYNVYAPPQQIWMDGMRPPERPETYTAQCIKMSPSAYMAQAFAEARGEFHDEAPTVWCTCGFYAHYDPATDFYPSSRWGRAFNRLAGQPEAQNLIIVRAVAEVSGKVIMGTLGVRAAKVKILALAIDWEKRIKPEPLDFYNYEMNRLAGDILDYEGNPNRPRFSRSWGADADEDALVTSTTERVAQDYGIKFFGDVGDMYAAYPKPDVSALIEEQAPPKPEPELVFDDTSLTPTVTNPVQWGKVSTLKEVLAEQAAYYARAMGFQGVTAERLILDEIIGFKDETPFERALRLKKNRPAAPGTGIDRRRGRLR